jgi:hypothetical protein
MSLWTDSQLAFAQQWTQAELDEVLTGVQTTANALDQFVDAAFPGSPSNARTLFRLVMNDTFVLRVQNGFQIASGNPCNGTMSAGCTSNFAPAPAVIFFGNVNVIQHTMVHELGHRFNARSDGNGRGPDSLYGRMSSAIVFDSTNRQIVFGSSQFTYESIFPPITVGAGTPPPAVTLQSDGRWFAPSEWRRGMRGWGSGPASIYNDYGVLICFALTSFQQNSFAIGAVGFPFGGEQGITEVDEATADMFLNWVYFTITSANQGFSNASWIIPRGVTGPCTPASAGTPQPTEMPGIARANWIANQLRDIFNIQTSWR